MACPYFCPAHSLERTVSCARRPSRDRTFAHSGKAKMSDVPCGTWEDYTICKQAGTVAEVTTWDDKAEFKDMHPALCLLGYSEAERNELYTMLCISLWLGNLKFKEDGQGSKVTNADVLKKSAELLQVPPDRLENAMVQRTMGGGVVEARSAAAARPYPVCRGLRQTARHVALCLDSVSTWLLDRCTRSLSSRSRRLWHATRSSCTSIRWPSTGRSL